MALDYPVYRSIVYINGRKVHFRSCGSGPVVFLLHGSPQSSWAVLPLAQQLAKQGLCAIAPDSPGYGVSHPFYNASVTPPTTVDYAEALVELANYLDIQEFGLYGFHTGAAIACTAAALYPERVTALTSDGLTAWTDAERNTLLQGYLPPFKPQWDGSHMAWVWARIEEQVAFFPWHIAEDRCRINVDMSPPSRIHANAMDVLRAGDGYRIAYHAAFTFRAESWLPQVKCPTLFACLTHDPLSAHYQRKVFSHHRTKLFDAPDDMYRVFAEVLGSSPGSLYRARAHTGEDNFGLSHGWVGKPGQSLAWSGTLKHADDRATLVLLHSAGGNKEDFVNLLRILCKHRNVIAFDLPGHGDSEDLTDPPTDVATIGQMIAEHLSRLGIDAVAAIGRGVGGLVAAWMVTHQHANNGIAFGLPDVPEQYKAQWADRYCTDLTPVWEGTHLIRAFRIARWERIYAPWFDRTAVARKLCCGLLDADSVHQRAVSILKAGNAWRAAVAAETTLTHSDLPMDERRFKYFAVKGDAQSMTQVLQQTPIYVGQIGADDSEWYPLVCAV
ncbi:MAG: alpha/beta fold hydrolase [Alteromonadaceae bacterium]|nr:alpha/beta fold hydrolase [Alteromonadaceae bacterium]